MPITRDYSPGHYERAFVKKETTFGTIEDPTATDHVRIAQSFSIGRKKARKPDNAKGDNAAPTEPFDLDSFTEWALAEGNVRPSGVLGTAPEFDALLEAALGTKTSPALTTTVSDASPGVSDADLASVTGLAVGDLIRFGTSGHVRRVTAIATLNVTWEPALPAAPTNGEAVTSGCNYKPAADYETSLTMLRDLRSAVEVYPGCWVNEATFKFRRDEWLLAGFTGQGCGKRVRIGDALITDAPLGIGAATANVTADEGELFDVSEGSWYGLLESEVVKITARSNDALTITRGQKSTAAASHAAGTELQPYRPTPTLVGKAITGITGYLYTVDKDGSSTPRATTFEEAEVKVANGFEARREFGSATAFGFCRTSPHRAVTVAITGKLRRLHGVLRDAASAGRKVGVVLVCGSTSGYICSIVLPRVVFDAGAIPDSPENGDAMITLTGTAYASDSTKDDEISIGFL